VTRCWRPRRQIDVVRVRSTHGLDDGCGSTAAAARPVVRSCPASVAGRGEPHAYVAAIWSFGDRSTISAGLSRYLAAPGGTGLASELGVVALHAGTLKQLRWSCAASTLTGVGNRITLYVNGSATPLAATWSGGATSGAGTPDLVSVAPGDTISVRIQLASGGTSITRPRVSVELELPSAIPWLSNGTDLYYDDGGSVGVGTDSPGEALSVNGVIESMSGGFRFPDGTLQTTALGGIQPIPPGSIVAFAGSAAPAGWLLCDGSLVNRATYPDLLAAIGVAHGVGDGITTFALPDYRGRFLRGVSGSSGRDRQADSRGPMDLGKEGNTGNAVGSVQEEALHAHDHLIGVGRADSFQMVPNRDARNTGRLAHFLVDDYNLAPQHTTYPTLEQETRPVNAYVNFIIKV
jgi:microcystin-dependent protein